jgi:Fe2+ transport system protein FeoA
MGFVTEATVKIEQAAPLGDPIELEVKGYCLSMCKNEACNVIIDVLAKKIE